jgi:hypothetical protein
MSSRSIHVTTSGRLPVASHCFKAVATRMDSVQ